MTCNSDSVRDAHAAWNAANDRLRAFERLLATALELYASGQGDLPQDLIDECQAMRKDCQKKFKAMLAVMGQRQNAGMH